MANPFFFFLGQLSRGKIFASLGAVCLPSQIMQLWKTLKAPFCNCQRKKKLLDKLEKGTRKQPQDGESFLRLSTKQTISTSLSAVCPPRQSKCLWKTL